ncbi:MAG: histidine phosphatase family protein [Solirubrobacterales bacterium]|nr:histidine phosphatase family protein [Solirubrobacterales bacterium]
MRVQFLRHGESLSNADPDRIAIPESEGDTLSERGLLQARAAAEAVAGLGIRRIVSSPMGRARQTAGAVSERLRLEPEVWEWLHELREPSEYPGLPRIEQERQRWSNRMSSHEDPEHRRGDGESFADLLRRVERTREQLVADDVEGTLLVGHGIFFRFMFARTLLGTEFAPRHADWLWRIGSLNCGLSTFDHVAGGGSEDPADIAGWRCVTWMSPTVAPDLATGTGGVGPGF